MLEAACGEDGQAGTGFGAGPGKEFSRLLAERMQKLELALDLDLGRNSRGYPVRFLDTIVHRCVHWLAGEAGSGSCLCVCVCVC